MWRNTGQPVRVLMLDARACFPLLAACVYWSWTTLYIALVGNHFLRSDLFCGPDAARHVPARATLARGTHSDRCAGLEPPAARVSALDLDRVERTMQALLSRDPLVVTYHDRSTGDVLSVSPEAAASRTGLLPAFLAAGQVVWRDLTGAGFDLDVVRDPAALFGFRVRGIGASSFATVMLATMEATAQASRAGAIVVNDFNLIWSEAARSRATPTSSTGASP